MIDSDTTVSAIRKLVADFVSERDWNQFHTPKNLAMSLAVEAAELMEHFQWISTEESRALSEQPDKVAAAAEELADVVSYALAMANELGIDIAAAMEAKMVKNAQKYPAAQYRGRYGPEHRP